MSGAHEPGNLAELSALVGAPVVAAERAQWGFANQTEIVSLADGRRLVVQRITRRFFAPQHLALAAAIPPALQTLGIRAPQLLAGDAQHDPPFAVREFLPGTPANTLLDSDANAIWLATAMGALLPRLATLDTDALPLPTTWTHPDTLANDMQRRLVTCHALLDEQVRLALAMVLTRLPALFAGRPGVFAHGDFCPVNALLLGEEAQGSPVLALVDFEEARVADALFDAAWWSWVVRFHHPECWRVAWPTFLQAADIPADTLTAPRIRALQLLRLLENLDDARAHEPASASWWAARLHTTAAWH